MNIAIRSLAALGVAVALTTAALADDGVQLIEQKIKAGLLYNFLRYTQWPAGAAQVSGTAAVCLYGGDPFDGHLKPMAGRTVNQHVIEIREVKAGDALATCAMLFVRSEQKAAWPDIRRGLVAKDVLTVADWEGFAVAGGMLEFTRVEERIGVKINVDAVAATHLKVEDRLLKLANAVHAPAPGN